MTLALLAFLGGVLTILSPCILPVLPFVFARAEQPFLRSGLPMLAGMAVTFAAIATLGTIGGSWAVNVNQYGRVIAMILLAMFAAALLSPGLAEWISRPFVALGNRMLPVGTAAANRPSLVRSGVLGVATGLLWAPCAGPILGLVLTGAIISGPNTQTTLLLFAFALGASASLAVAIFAGGRVFTALKKSLGAGEWLRRGLGIAVLISVLAIALGWDTGLLTRLSIASTTRLEQSLIDRISPASPADNAMTANPNAMTGSAMTGAMTGSMTAANSMMMSGKASGAPSEGWLSLDGATGWLNSPPLTPEELRGKVVLIDFWTYSCINCLRALPYVKSWHAKYKDHGLVVIGVHSPEFAFEKSERNVRRATEDLGVEYPVALDNDYAIWQAFNNRYWPAHYFIDGEGRIRDHHFGEGRYEESEQTIRRLLAETGKANLPSSDTSGVAATGVQAAADEANVQSPETYVGYERAEHFVSPQGFAPDREKIYALPGAFQLNEWALQGNWFTDKEKSTLKGGSGKIVFRFKARDLHLVLGPGENAKPVRFRVTLDGKPPAQDRGLDVDESGNGIVKEQRLYQLIRQHTDIGEHVFEIEFLDSDVQVYAFTFG